MMSEVVFFLNFYTNCTNSGAHMSSWKSACGPHAARTALGQCNWFDETRKLIWRDHRVASCKPLLHLWQLWYLSHQINENWFNLNLTRDMVTGLMRHCSWFYGRQQPICCCNTQPLMWRGWVYDVLPVMMVITLYEHWTRFSLIIAFGSVISPVVFPLFLLTHMCKVLYQNESKIAKYNSRNGQNWPAWSTFCDLNSTESCVE